jgi:hypothetical protein
MRLTATVNTSRDREARASRTGLPIDWTISAGEVMTVPSILYWAPASEMTTRPKTSMFTGMPQKLPTTIDPFFFAARVKSEKLSTKVP